MKVLIGASIVLLFLIVASSVSANDSVRKNDYSAETDSGRIELTSKQKEEAMSAVRARLKYPRSARFQSIYGVRSSSARQGFRICGKVEARNGEHRYVGARQFAYSDGRTLILKETPNRGFIPSKPMMMREVTLSSRPRAVVGSWWVSCRVSDRGKAAPSTLTANK